MSLGQASTLVLRNFERLNSSVWAEECLAATMAESRTPSCSELVDCLMRYAKGHDDPLTAFREWKKEREEFLSEETDDEELYSSFLARWQCNATVLR